LLRKKIVKPTQTKKIWQVNSIEIIQLNSYRRVQ